MTELSAPALRFQSLETAVDYICRQIEAGDATPLARIMSGIHRDDAYDYNRYFTHTVFPVLSARHQAGCLRALYKGQEFPEDATAYKLGGHDSELGYIHIDFVRQPDGWTLQRIWICR